MLTLSIQQPWAWAIFHGKPVENRNWSTAVRGPILIHAGKKIDYEAYGFIKNLLGISVPKILPVGGIVGRCEIVDCVKKFDSPWFFGVFGFVLQNASEVPFMPYRGQLGFFNVSYHCPGCGGEVCGPGCPSRV